MDIQNVDRLPVLDQSDYPSFPEIPSGKVLSVAISPWRHAEPEKMSGAVIMACMVVGQWKPVSMSDLVPTLLKYADFRFMPDMFWNGVWELRTAGDIDIVQLGEDQFIVPHPSMAHKALNQSAVGYYDEYVELPRPAEPAIVSRRNLGSRLLGAIRPQAKTS